MYNKCGTWKKNTLLTFILPHRTSFMFNKKKLESIGLFGRAQLSSENL